MSINFFVKLKLYVSLKKEDNLILLVYSVTSIVNFEIINHTQVKWIFHSKISLTQ